MCGCKLWGLGQSQDCASGGLGFWSLQTWKNEMKARVVQGVGSRDRVSRIVFLGLPITILHMFHALGIIKL